MNTPGHRCPFLREVQVKSCQASSIRKVIPRSSDVTPEERCSSPEYVTCPVMKEFHEEHPQASRCPFLHESLVQYCSAAAVPKYIPYSESMLTRCGTENHKYCEQYLAYARPKGSHQHTESGQGPSIDVGGISYPTDRSYTANHMWMDLNEDGYCHIGIDAFFSSVIGKVENITFAGDNWDGRPAVVFHACGIDMPIVFPYVLEKAVQNSSIRSHPNWVMEHPYSLGWLFEGHSSPGMTAEAPMDKAPQLLSAQGASEELRQDLDKIVHHFTRRATPSGTWETPLMADGGCLCFEEIHRLAREEILYLYNEFFSPSRTHERGR